MSRTSDREPLNYSLRGINECRHIYQRINMQEYDSTLAEHLIWEESPVPLWLAAITGNTGNTELFIHGCHDMLWVYSLVDFE